MAKKPANIKAWETKGDTRRSEDLLNRIALLESKLKSRKHKVVQPASSNGGRQEKQKYFDEKAHAVRLGVELKTLQSWRGQSKGPSLYKIGRSVRYRLRDILGLEPSFPSSDGNSG